MATFTTTTDRFPYNTTVTVYPQSNWPTAGLPPSGAPVGSSTTSAVVSTASVLTFTGLQPNTAYFMTAEIGGSYRYVGFTSPSDLVQPGFLPAPEAAGLASLGMTANRAWFQRFVLDEPRTFSKAAIHIISAATANDACDVGIYEVSGTTLAKIVTAGATSAVLNSGNNTIATISFTATTLQANKVYYRGFSCGAIGGTQANLSGFTGLAGGFGQQYGTAIPEMETGFVASSHALPTTISSLTSTTGNPVVWLRES